jgi:hypothetical protein
LSVGAMGYGTTMNDGPHDDPRRPQAIWHEALWSIGLIGVVMVLTLVASALGRV